MSPISTRQKDHFIFALHVAASASRGLRDYSGGLRSVVYYGPEAILRFVRIVAPL